MNLFDKTSHQPETMPLAVQLGFEATAVVADCHGRHFDAAGGLAHGHVDRSLVSRKRMIVAVGDDFGDDNSQSRHHVKVQDKPIQRPGVFWRSGDGERNLPSIAVASASRKASCLR
jgi:hypothetical protein